jgi:succinate dehydrogenase / fumarate reductase membrane anchor subunit
VSRKASGLKAWAVQRVTAIFVALFTLYLVAVFLFSPPADFDAWTTWVGSPVVSVMLLLYVVSILMHAWIGIRDVLLDYVQPIAVRATLLGLVAMGLIAMGLWSAQALILARLA